LCSFPAGAAHGGLSRCCQSRLFLNHVTPMKADKNEENSMTIIDFALMLNGTARLVAAVAMLISAIRRRR